MALRPFQFRPGEGLRPGLIRIVDRIAKRSAALPGFRAGKAEHAIHEARLLVKLLRALVWTARPALDQGTCNRIRLHLRAAARCLAATREATVLAATLSNLAGRTSRRRHRVGYALAAQALARNLTASGDASVRRKLAATSRGLERVGLLFRSEATKKVLPWPDLPRRQRAAARSCHRAMKRALSSGQARDFHEWRKKAKRLLFQLRVTEIHPDQSMQEAIDLVDQLQSKLGDHHDLVVLEEDLRKSSFLSRRSGPARKVFRHIHTKKRTLEKQLRPLGRRCRRACTERFKTRADSSLFSR